MRIRMLAKQSQLLLLAIAIILCGALFEIKATEAVLIRNADKLKSKETDNCTVKPPSYNIDLDDDPYHRWDHVIQDYPAIANQSMQQFYNVLIADGVPKEAIPLLRKIAGTIHRKLPEPYRSELQGVADKSNLDIADTTLINIAYDLSAYCTSIVASDANGTIWHGRNLDYNGTDLLRNTTIFVNFRRNGQMVYSGVTFVGYIGVITAIKPNAFTLSIDERDVGSMIENMLELLDPKVSLLGFTMRELFANIGTYREAIDFIGRLHMPAPVYIILGGTQPGEGAVVTRSRLRTIDVWSLALSSGRWYLVETNYDHWNDPPTWDNRRIPAEKAMNATGQNSIDKNSLFSVLSVSKVFNQYTVYTTVMSAANPTLTETWIRC